MILTPESRFLQANKNLKSHKSNRNHTNKFKKIDTNREVRRNSIKLALSPLGGKTNHYSEIKSMIAQAPQNNLRVDPHQIARHLELLNHKLGDTVFLRGFFPSDDPRKGARKADATTIESIAQTAEKFQNEGMGIYLVVNGGGQRDAEVETCRAIFYEHDNLSKELQLGLWETLGLPEPTFQVDTGGKSIHSYWVLNEPIDPTRWRSLQTDLLDFANADRSLKNPSRVMRLAGCYHLSAKGANPTSIVSESGARYNYEELRAIVPPKQKTPSPSPSLPLSKNMDDVPLLECIPKADRELVLGGAGEGERNTLGYKLACSLIGAERRLPDLGIAYTGTARELLNKYRFYCSPALDDSEAEQIWKSALASNPTATLTDDAILNCVRAWRRKQRVVPTLNGLSSSASDAKSSNGDGNVVRFPRQTLNTEALSLEIEALASGGGSRSQVRRELIRLSKFYEVQPSEIEKLYRERQIELDQVEDRLDLVARLPSLVESQNTRLNLSDFLWGDGGILAESMATVATEMPTAPEFLFTSFLPVAASRLGTGAQIVVKESGNFKQPAIFRTCLVAKSGDMKSPPQKAVIEPLEQLENEAREAYAEEMKDYEEEMSLWKKDGGEGEKPKQPICKRYILQNGSIESRIAIHSENPRGLLLYRDEWAAHLTGRNKFRQGKGDDEQNELTEFDGGQLIKDVVDASKRLHLAKTAISRIGTTQFSKLKELMGGHDDGVGEFGRWLFCVAACPPPYTNLEEDKPSTLTKLLKDLYRNLELMPAQEYFLSKEAKPFYQKYHNSLVDLAYSEQTPGIQIALPKLRSYFARFTLLLHCLNQALAGSVTKPATHIDDFTVLAATELCNYFLGQLRVIYALNSPQEELSGRVLYLKTWFHCKTNVTARQILRSLSQYKKSGKEDLQNDLQILLDAGYITQQVKGKTVNYSSVTGTVTGTVTGNKQAKSAESIDNNGVINPLKNELSLTVAGSVADLNLETEGISANFTPICHQKSDFSISEPVVFDISQPSIPSVTTDSDGSHTSIKESDNPNTCVENLITPVTDSDSSDTCPQSLVQGLLEVGDTCEKPGDSSDTCLVKSSNVVSKSESLGLGEWKVGDVANYCGENVSIYKIDVEDGSIMVRRQNGELVNVEKCELFHQGQDESTVPEAQVIVPPTSLLPDKGNVNNGIHVFQWKTGDKADYLGEKVSVFEVIAGDELVTVIRRNGEKFKAEKFLLFPFKSSDAEGGKLRQNE